ncbi:hypothetical protein HER10_EVM0007496 [Colletotrichum scovillei]|uniref:ATP-nad kinase n=1 Tax=Colletotrichum scovillei TaxID=1209932 RepID=A0A9P7UIV8_9PEZI|nr:uncharacterized protein HER10_EVM0007496 [Colletotrichum scovillei]KAF4779881.1 hypothetical protein HER10_EVM0007496 [Colletotrichum scovillei]KAG7058212.1 ATP-nad kinase [Colletotrichum scovillei]KAG7076889.1 ATP-nad kinase [Colletotrichum scovillei]KAG7083988.1 ATP-nad kinase [Colletotrichum scovillei]
MAEVLATSSAVVTLTATTLQGIRGAREKIDKITRAPELIANIKKELQLIQNLMERLEISVKSNDTEVLSVTADTNVQSALTACGASCCALDNEVDKLLQRSKDGRVHLMDRVNIGLFGKDKLQIFVDELRICKQTVDLALAGANFLASIEQTKQLQAILKQVEANDNDAYSEATPQKSRDLIKGYEELQASLFAQVNERRSKLTVSKVKVLESQAIIGIHGADGTDGELDVQLGNVEGQGSNMLVGYSKGVDLNAAFFKKDN